MLFIKGKYILLVLTILLFNTVSSVTLATCIAGCKAGCEGCNAMVRLIPNPAIRAVMWGACAAV